jgi:S-adenosylmethionine/arginine decarboxylase-like enzyme
MKAQMYNYCNWIEETNPIKLKNKYKKLLIKSGFNILNEVEYYFSPMGYTILYLLSESHFAIHTFPEENQSYIELSSCVKKQFDSFVKKS